MRCAARSARSDSRRLPFTTTSCVAKAIRTSSLLPSAYRNCVHGNIYVLFKRTISSVMGCSSLVFQAFGLSANAVVIGSFHLVSIYKCLRLYRAFEDGFLPCGGDAQELPSQSSAAAHPLGQYRANFSGQFRCRLPRRRTSNGFVKALL